MWMRPPSDGWKKKKVRKKGKGQSRPLGILAIILILVGFIGLMMVKHSSDTALLFQGIGDLHRQATYISELSTPPVAPTRLRLVLDEFTSFIHKFEQDLEKPLLIGGLSIPGHGSDARAAVKKLNDRWKTIYSPTLTEALSSVGMGASVAVRENSKALVDEIETISQEIGSISLSGGSQLFLIQVALLMVGAMLTIRLLMSVQHELLEPMDHMRNWASRMREGNLATRIPIPLDGDFVELAHNINALSDELQTLVREQTHQVQHQHDLLSQKTRSLSTLYNVAESLNAPEDVDQHISRFMGVLADVVDAKAGIARLRSEGDEMRLVASMGVNTQVIEQQQLVSMEQCLCDDDMTSTQLSRPRDFELHTGFRIEDVLPNLSKENGVVLTVPMLYKDKNLGVYNFFVEKSSLDDWGAIRDLLTSIGQHLGVAIHQSQLDLQDKRLSIMQERAMLAHELHDSLAQILASLGFQVRMLEDSLDAADPQGQARQDLGKLRAGVDEANKELRQLLVHFRATYDERGLIPSLEKLVEGFQQEGEMQAFFHNECQDVSLSPDEEIQVLHIVQEALTNARKHSQATAVRILLGCDNQGSYRILVEDDGKGLPPSQTDAGPGEQLGLSIMRERSFYLGGTLQVDSDPGEGTRIELRFEHASG
jgi:two-component system nitrate/nitrite sensor histidine kinase NarX